MEYLRSNPADLVADKSEFKYLYKQFDGPICPVIWVKRLYDINDKKSWFIVYIFIVRGACSPGRLFKSILNVKFLKPLGGDW